MDELENLRAEALRFADGLPPFPASAEWDDYFEWDDSYGDYTQFLIAVQHWFLNHPDGAAAVGSRTHTRLLNCVSDAAGQLPSLRFNLYARVCVLFVGHPYLFNCFERLRLMNDGLEGTRRRIRQWRDYIRREYLHRISAVLEDCSSALVTLLLRPRNLTVRNLVFIEETRDGVAGDDDPLFPFPMLDLMQDPIGWRHFYLPGLLGTYLRFLRMQCFVSQYFALLSYMQI